MKEGFASISIKGIHIIAESPETNKLYKDRLDIILVSRKEWHRIENLLQSRKRG